MPTIKIERTIHARVENVFQAVAHIDQFSEVIPEITKVEFLTEQKQGVGTRFRETRKMGKREATVELEVTEYEPPRRVRLVSDTHGTVWDTVFEMQQEGDSTRMQMTMEARAYKLLPKLMNPLVNRLIKGAVAKDMDRIKAHLE